MTYYLSTQHEYGDIVVRRYSDDSIIQTYSIEHQSISPMRLSPLTDSLFILTSTKQSVYSFDCYDPCSLKCCYDVDVGRYYCLFTNILIAVKCGVRDDGIHVTDHRTKCIAYQFDHLEFKLIGEWQNEIGWACSDTIKLSNHQMIQMCHNYDIDRCPQSYLTTISKTHTDRVDITTVPIRHDQLAGLGMGVIDEFASKQSSSYRHNLTYYPNHRLLVAQRLTNVYFYRRSIDGFTWNYLASISQFGLELNGIVDGELKSSSGEKRRDIDVRTMKIVERCGVASCFYAHPSKRKIEQIYLPLLLPVFKGCKDLALLVVSYLEWDNDIVN